MNGFKYIFVWRILINCSTCSTVFCGNHRDSVDYPVSTIHYVIQSCIRPYDQSYSTVFLHYVPSVWSIESTIRSNFILPMQGESLWIYCLTTYGSLRHMNELLWIDLIIFYLWEQNPCLSVDGLDCLFYYDFFLLSIWCKWMNSCDIFNSIVSPGGEGGLPYKSKWLATVLAYVYLLYGSAPPPPGLPTVYCFPNAPV